MECKKGKGRDLHRRGSLWGRLHIIPHTSTLLMDWSEGVNTFISQIKHFNRLNWVNVRESVVDKPQDKNRVPQEIWGNQV
jgi:hypothetical protein